MLKKIKELLASIFKPSGFLCDSCRYDYPSACRNPARPNARTCPDYKRR